MIYIKNKYPNAGSEVLWKKDENSNKVLINPNSFPFFNLNLAITNAILLKNQHHLLKEFGLKWTGKILKKALSSKDNHYINKNLNCRREEIFNKNHKIEDI